MMLFYRCAIPRIGRIFCIFFIYFIVHPGSASCLNPIYQYSIIAKENMLTGDGAFISEIKPEVSVNENGQVAFVGTIETGGQLFVGEKPYTPENISKSPAGQNITFPQINNNGRVVTRELLSGNSLIRIWNTHNPGDSSVIASSTLSAFSQLTLPTLGNTELVTQAPLVGFLGRVGDLPFALFANDTGMRDSQDLVSDLSGTVLTRFRSMSAASDKRSLVVQFATQNDEGRIGVYHDINDEGLWQGTVIASTADTTGGWLQLGTSPAISDSGKVVAFAAEHSTDGQGIYLAYTTSTFTAGFNLVKIIGTDEPITWNENTDPITFESIDLVNRVGVLHNEVGNPGFTDDSIILAFIAKPQEPSRTDPTDISHPFYFSDQPGIWTLQVNLEYGLDIFEPPHLYLHASTPAPVVQAGDIIDGGTVSSFTLYDPLSSPLRDMDGLPRQIQKSDHHLAFTVQADNGVRVVRAAYLDTDGDSLVDHWETHGIDMDGDASPELPLHRLGADPLHRDIFLEIDWLQDRRSGGYRNWTNALPPSASTELVKMFANAPVTNPDGTNGIKLHIDAGASNPRGNPLVSLLMAEPDSINMGDNPFDLDGGETIGLEDDPAAHIDVVYFGKPDSFNVPGVNTRSFHDIKDKHFGRFDQWARSLAFRYTLLVDYHELHLADDGHPFTAGVAGATWSTLSSDFDLPPRSGGYVVKIISGEGADQVRVVQGFTGSRLMHMRREWETLPDSSSRFVLIAGWGGMGEVEFLPEPDYHSRPGNDFVISLGTYGVSEGGWLANLDVFWRTIGHELGHTLGLRHGGWNHQNDKREYLSIMNYLYADVAPSFAGAESTVFNDWEYLKYDAYRTGYLLDNTYDKMPAKLEFGDLHTPDPNVVQYEEIVGHPVDLDLPDISVLSPAANSVVPFEGDLDVTLQAGDDVGVRSVVVLFDLDGDGKADQPEERLQASDLGGGVYSATFTGVSGPFGTRGIVGLAYDTSGNLGSALVPVSAGSDSGAQSILLDSSGIVAAQADQSSGGSRQIIQSVPLAVPGSGRLTLTASSTPPVRLVGDDPVSYDTAVFSIQFEGQEIDLHPFCNAPASDPSICTTYWQASSSGELVVNVWGPARFDTDGAFLGHPQQDYTLKVTFKAVDITPPQAEIISPQKGDFVETGESLTVHALVSDDYGVNSVECSFDLDGDGTIDGAAETITATDSGSGIYQADFIGIGGEASVRSINISAVDDTGNQTDLTAFVDVRVPDTIAPQVEISSPPVGWPIESGEILTVEVTAYDDVELSSIVTTFDVDGNGTIAAGTDESINAVWIAPNLYSASFQDISGANGSRTVNVTAVDTSGNESYANLPITVGGVEPITETVATESGTIAAQPSIWSGGSQQVIDFDPIILPTSGTVSFIVTASPSVRALGQNIQRSDSYVKNITLEGVAYTLYPVCNNWDEPISVCTTTFEATEGGTLDFSLLGPGSWNIWGEFSGHPAQDYEIEIQFVRVDITRPEISILAPSLGDDIDPDYPLPVTVMVTDDITVASVICLFDVNGDGDKSDYGEQKAAANTGGDTYEVSFTDLGPTPGTRTIEVLATDTSFNSRSESISVGVGGVGTGENALTELDGTIASQVDDFNGGVRQVIPIGPFSIPSAGRVTFTISSTPSTRSFGTNLERHDPKIINISFNGQPVSLTPQCNEWDQDPAICTSVYDTNGAGTLNAEILGSASYNIWGEFIGSPEQEYNLKVLFLPGPSVTGVVPNTGSVAGHETVLIHGSGFAYNSIVLFDEVPGTDVVRISSSELSCTTPPGIAGSANVRVLSPDLENEPWNYGAPYGLFGDLNDAFTYQAITDQPPLQAEHLIGTWRGFFPSVGSEEARQQAPIDFIIPGSGRLRFETWAFVPILSPIPGPFEDPDNLTWHNESSVVTRLTGGDGARYYTDVSFSDLAYTYGPVISNATRIVGISAVGNGQGTVEGPARWNAFWRQFGDFVMVSAPSQTWGVAAWFADQPELTGCFPNSGPDTGGTLVTLTGAHFAENSAVSINGKPADEITVVDANTLTCRIPSGDAGTASVEISLLGMRTELPGGFTYISVDTDSDGLPDTIENGSACLDSSDSDSDDDGIIDGDEDINHDGVVDVTETDPCNADTDGDFIQDGTELGIVLADIGPDTDNTIFVPDSDATPGSDPLSADTDHDGIEDGIEDANHNGSLDPGETSSSHAGGDINADSQVDFYDLIVILRTISGISPAINIDINADINGDRDIGLAEAIHVIRFLSGS